MALMNLCFYSFLCLYSVLMIKTANIQKVVYYGIKSIISVDAEKLLMLVGDSSVTSLFWPKLIVRM